MEPRKIEDVLARRSDLSTFLVHLTRTNQSTKKSAEENLNAIVSEGCVKAGEPRGLAVKNEAVEVHEQREKILDSQRVVCFTETPLEHTSLLCGKIAGRSCHLEPYGIAITKKQARKGAVNPVWYVDQTSTPGENRPWLTRRANELIADAAEADPCGFGQSAIGTLAPFWEVMQPAGSGQVRKEFWWEREWRHVGDFGLPPKVIVICPEVMHDSVRQLVAPGLRAGFIDANWSLEQVIARLAGFDQEDVGPM